MNLNHLSDKSLLQRTEELARSERELLVEVLHHLREIERRKLFSTLRCTSLFDYCTRKLGYSEDQACRRIAAMKLLRELPEITEKINSGTLTLSTISLAQTLFRKERKAGLKKWSRVKKLAILEQMQSQPRRQVEKLILENTSDQEILTPDKIRAVSASKIEIKFVAPEELQVKIDRLKGLLAHRFPELTLAELFNNLCELGLKKYDLSLHAPRAARVKTGQIGPEAFHL